LQVIFVEIYLGWRRNKLAGEWDCCNYWAQGVTIDLHLFFPLVVLI
jgi:hypothetical protein